MEVVENLLFRRQTTCRVPPCKLSSSEGEREKCWGRSEGEVLGKERILKRSDDKREKNEDLYEGYG